MIFKIITLSLLLKFMADRSKTCLCVFLCVHEFLCVSLLHLYMCLNMCVYVYKRLIFRASYLGDSAQFALVKASQMPAMLMEEKKLLKDEKTELRKDKTKRQYQCSQYHKVL